MDKSNRTIAQLSFTICILFSIVIFIAVSFPEYLPFFCLSANMCYIIALQMISFVLLLAFIQTPPLPTAWRIFCVIASFVLLIESMFIR